MKKFYLSLLIVFTLTQADAQYKKASFFNRTGTTHEFSVSERFVSDPKATFTGISYAFGRDNAAHIFSSNELEVLLPVNYKYSSYNIPNPEDKLDVSGKYSAGLLYRFNLGYYLANVANEEAKFKPFITGGFNFSIAMVKIKTMFFSPDGYANPYKFDASDGLNYGVNAGLGGIYSFTKAIGLKVTAGYSYQRYASSGTDGDHDIFTPFGSHPYVTVGIRFRKETDE